MATSKLASERQASAPRSDDEEGSTGDVGLAALDVLNDDYTLEIIEALQDRPRTARELIAESTASKPTVYRRLDSLETSGLVASRTTLDPDGHHRLEYRLIVDRLVVDLDQELQVRLPDLDQP